MKTLCRNLYIGFLVSISLTFPSCTTAPQKKEYQETGTASWYHPSLHGLRTANGERYNKYAMTAAHRTLPFGTRVNVKDVRTGRMVTVRINDRGPFIKGRIIDLSSVAARRLGMKEDGVAPVELTLARPREKSEAPALTLASNP